MSVRMELIERAEAMASLLSALDGAAHGSGCVALVTGEAGIGKTSLVTDFTTRMTTRARVLWGGCDPLVTPRPLGPLHDIARDAGPRLLAALGGTGGTGAPSGRETILAAVLDELSRGKEPTIFVVEDVHWGDEATFDMLRFVGRRITRLPALLVLTYRDDETAPTHPLRAVVGELPAAAVRRIRLEPLSAAGVRALVRASGRGDRLLPEELHAVTSGNPFFVTEALAVSSESGVPVTIRDAVLARASRLTSVARGVMELASVVPGRIERWLIDAALAPEATVLDELAAVGMTRHADGSLSFRHELARRAVGESLSADRRRSLHARLLRLLRERPEADDVGAVGGDYARLVHHADGADDLPAVRQLAPLAAEQAAQQGAHREAARHFAAALRNTFALPRDERAHLLERRSYECYLTDQIADAIDARKEALLLRRSLGEDERAGENLRWLSRLHWFMGMRAEAEQYSDEAVALLETLPPGRQLAMAYSNVSQLAMLADDTDAAVSWGERAIALAQSLGDEETLTHALNNVGTAELIAGRPEGGTKLQRSLSLSLQHSWHEHAARAYTNFGSVSVIQRDFESAQQILDEGITWCAEHDLASWTLYMRGWRARLRFETGDWNACLDDADAVLASSRSAAVTRVSALAARARVLRHRDLPGWEALLDEGQALATNAKEIQRLEAVTCAALEAAWLAGELAPSHPAIASAIQQVRLTPALWPRAELILWLVRAGAAPDDNAALLAPVQRAVDGDWRGAAEEWRTIGHVVEYAYALAECEDEASQRQSLEVFERVGSLAGAALVRRRLLARGVRGVPRGSRPTTRAHPLGLTSRQQEILALLCEGLRNAEIAQRLIVSEKTVDHHVSAVLAKLEVRSRTEAVAKAAALGLGRTP